jgi:2-oxoisovalerate dehydrogenase E1 component beta subunit
LARQQVADNGQALLLDVCYRLREGTDITLVTWGAMTVETLKAAQELENDGVSCDVIDLATLSPIDHDSILESVATTGRLVIIHEAPKNCGIGAEIAATVAEKGLYDLHAPIRRVTGYDTIIPLSPLEYEYIPSVARITDAVRATLAA